MRQVIPVLVLFVIACGRSGDAPASVDDSVYPVEAIADTTAPLPLLDLKAAEILQLGEAWKGDFDGTTDRRFIRVLVPFSRTLYYLDRAEQKGVAFETLREFEATLPPGPNGVKRKVVIVPTRRDRLFPALEAGLGDIAIGGITVSGERSTRVDFSTPTMAKVSNVVVSGRALAPVASEDGLAGLEIHVRDGSVYQDDLAALNQRLTSRGKAPVIVKELDGALEDEDVLQMVDGGIVPATVTNLPFAKFWGQLYDSLTVHDAAPLRTDGELAWALRKNTPALMVLVNDFIEDHRVGTTFGNMMIKRYLGSAERLKNPGAVADRERLKQIRGYFETYAGKYDLPWMLVAAQAYQESQFDQGRRSHVGAVGVMQIKPETAADKNVGITGVDQVEPNIHAGIKYLKFIADRYFADSTIDKLNRGLFALAAYNAGPGRVRQLRRKATEAGLDANVWFGNVEVIAAREIGRETVDYVSNIYKYYTVYRGMAALRDSSSGR
ncbi:MAG TPA: transporter substrate-binding domain-containing protein [Gemmatimonadales bacterium]|nr:transporter substrate-binding domain-containing protein [Gemmatimonadales bacterium]